MAKKKIAPKAATTPAPAKTTDKKELAARPAAAPVPSKKQPKKRQPKENDSIILPFDDFMTPAIRGALSRLVKTGGINDLMDALDSALDSDLKSPEFEDASEYARSRDKKSPPMMLVYQGKLFCVERIKDIFLAADYEVDDIFANDFIIDGPDIIRMFVRVGPKLPIIRLLIPVFFRKKLSLAKRQAWCCEVMEYYPSIRVCFEEDDVFMCLDYDYSVILHTAQLINTAANLSDFADLIYADFSELLNPESIGLVDCD